MPSTLERSNLDRDPLLPRARAAAEIDHALAALAQPREKLEAAQAQRIAGLERLGRHDPSGIASKIYANAVVVAAAPQRGPGNFHRPYPS
jgi:hypothetical protein